MNDHLHYLKWFYENPHTAFDKRFFILSLLILAPLLYGFVLTIGVFNLPQAPISFFGVWLVLTVSTIFWGFGQFFYEKRILVKMKYAVHQLDSDTAEKFIKKIDSATITTPSFSFQFDLLKATFYCNSGEPVLAYAIYQKLRRRALLPKESCRLHCTLASLLFEQGDFKSFRKEIKFIKNANGNNYEPLSLLLLESRALETSDNLEGAKELLEEGLTHPNIDGLNKALFLHQLALLESYYDNLNIAISYYSQAWSILKNYNHFKQSDVTVGNLLMLHLKLGDHLKAEKLLTEFKKSIDDSNVKQLIALHNLTINMARELDDRDLLESEYHNADQALFPQLNEKECLVFEITGLRMRLNDAVDFQSNLIKVMEHLTRSSLVGIDKFRAYSLVTRTLNQALEQYGHRNDWIAYQGWILLEWVRNQDSMDEIQNSLPLNLFYVKEEWFKLQLEAIKLRLNLFPKSIPKIEFKKLFDLLSEFERVASDKENDQSQIHTLVLIVDEYITFKDQFGNDFTQDFKVLTLDSLQKLDQLMLRYKNKPSFYQYMIALGYFYSRLNINQSSAFQWVELFDSKKTAINHYASWFRSQYKIAKDYANLSK